MILLREGRLFRGHHAVSSSESLLRNHATQVPKLRQRAATTSVLRETAFHVSFCKSFVYVPADILPLSTNNERPRRVLGQKERRKRFRRIFRETRKIVTPRF